MAGDIPADETIIIRNVDRRAEAVHVGEANPVESALVADASTRVLHRYGRIDVVCDRSATTVPRRSALPTASAGDDRPSSDDHPSSDDGPPSGDDPLAIMIDTGELDRIERLGLAAFRLRTSSDYQQAKQNRSRADEAWDMSQPCTDVPPPRGASTLEIEADPAADVRTQGSPAVSTPGAGTPGTVRSVVAAAVVDDAGVQTATSVAAGPTSGFMEGSITVGVIIVEGPTVDLQFTAAERTKTVAEIQNGLSWYATYNPAADLTFTYDINIVRISTPPDPSADDLEAAWRDPVMAQLGYAPNFDGVYDYVDDLRDRHATQWSYCAFITKYPLRYFAYSSIGGPRLVLSYDNDGWGPDNLDRVFAHETGHIFGSPDEYASSGCNCGGAWGRFATPNGNCDGCAPESVSCLMRTNSFDMCRYTPSHIGWGRGAGGNPVLVQSNFGVNGNFELVVPSAFAGMTHLWRDNNVGGFPWRSPTQVAQAIGRIDALTMIQSRLAAPGALEVLARIEGSLVFLWRDSGPSFRWSTPVPVMDGVAGTPSLIHSRLGRLGTFEALVPAADVGFFHLSRNNDVAGYPWSRPVLAAANLGHVNAVSLIQGTFGGGNLEAVASVGGRLVHLYRTQDGLWRTSVVFAEGVTGNPVLVQGGFGWSGNFEIVVPSATGGLLHFYRDNDRAGFPWFGPTVFGTELGQVDAATMIQSSFGRHLEVVARVGDRLYAMARGSSGNYEWYPPGRIF